MIHQRLYINVDHVATLRQARRGASPDPVTAAEVCEQAGADGITAHLREDRRHIQDQDIERLAKAVTTVLNLEMACTDEMLAIATHLRPHQVTLVPERREEVTTEGGLDLRPHQVTLVPERREEVTTEGGLDVSRDRERLATGIKRLNDAGIRTSLFIDPDPIAVGASRELGAAAIELHTGAYSHHPNDGKRLEALRNATDIGVQAGLSVHAGHGLTVQNVTPVAAIRSIEELNIGHSVVSRALFVGLAEAVRELRRAMDQARSR